MKLAKSSPESEVIRRLGGRPSVGDALIRRDGLIGVVVPSLDNAPHYWPRGTNVQHGVTGGVVSTCQPWDHFKQMGWRYLEPASSFRLLSLGWARMIDDPFLVRVEQGGFLTGTLGNAQLEFAAAVIVRYHQDNGLVNWTPILAADFFEWLKTSIVLEWMRNPVWRPNFVGLIDGGWISGWTTDEDREKRLAAIGTVTPKFIEAVSTPRAGGFPKIKRVLS